MLYPMKLRQQAALNETDDQARSANTYPFANLYGPLHSTSKSRSRINNVMIYCAICLAIWAAAEILSWLQ